MSQNDIENNKSLPIQGTLNTGAKKIEIPTDSQVPSNKEKESYRKVVELINIWEQEVDDNADENWKEFEEELDQNRIEIKSTK